MTDIWPVISTMLTLLVMGLIVPLLQYVRALKTNHLAHIEKRLEVLETKIDAHIAFHLKKGD